MAFKGRGANDVDFDSLQVTLVNSKLQQQNPALYLTINQIIARLKLRQQYVNNYFENVIGDINIDTNNNIEAILRTITRLLESDFLTWSDESSYLTNSRELIAGDGITFDDTIANQRIISGGGFSYVPMVTGAEPLEIMSTGAGDLLLIAYEP
jgi:hypothetical protein